MQHLPFPDSAAKAVCQTRAAKFVLAQSSFQIPSETGMLTVGEAVQAE